MDEKRLVEVLSDLIKNHEGSIATWESNRIPTLFNEAVLYFERNVLRDFIIMRNAIVSETEKRVTGTCGTCRYHINENGQCRRRAPVMMSGRGFGTTEWPSTNTECFCGEYEFGTMEDIK